MNPMKKSTLEEDTSDSPLQCWFGKGFQKIIFDHILPYNIHLLKMQYAMSVHSPQESPEKGQIKVHLMDPGVKYFLFPI